MDSKIFHDKLNRIRDLPTLPTVAVQVNRMLQDIETSTSDLALIIEKDQAMAGKILQLVNSAFYGFRSKINTITNALVLLGFNTVRNAVLSLAVLEAFSGSRQLDGFDAADFWHHSLAVAVASKQIAERARIQAPDSCFVAGLLHDIGKVVLARFFPDHFAAVWQAAVDEYLTFYEAEKKNGTVTHPLVGSSLIKKWQLPQDLTAAAKYHHRPADTTADTRELVAVVYLADVLVNHYKTDTVEPFDAGWWQAVAHTDLKDRLPDIHLWHGELQTEIDAACEFFIGGHNT